jgi:uncharacterized membrane protein YphA (DoxX/SURF4 family)
MRILGIGQILFALAGAGIAVLSFKYGDLAPMWQFYLPANTLWREVWLYTTALLLAVASIGLFIPRMALPGAILFAVYYAVCAATRITPIVSQPLEVGAWYGFVEAINAFAGAWILYALLRRQAAGWRETPAIAGESAVRIAQILFGVACAFYGLSHFVYADYTASMVPGWLPASLGFAYFTGAGHIAAGVGVVFGIFPRLAATLEAIMMSLFGLLVWLPSLFAQPTPKWATPPLNQWSEIVVNVMLAAVAWIVADSLRKRPWGFARA